MEILPQIQTKSEAMRSYVCVLVAIVAISAAEITGIRVDTSAAEITDCNIAQCKHACIAIGFKDGYCKDGKCWCGKPDAAQRVEKQITEIRSATIAAEITACNNDQCNHACIALRWEGGYCKDGMCWCWKHNAAQRVEKRITEIRPATIESSQCVIENCVSDCTVRKYYGAACRNGECMCSKDRLELGTWRPMNDIATNYKDKTGSEVEACTEAVRCLEACQHHGAAGGFCLSNVCWCSMSYSRKTTRRVRPVIELQGNITSNSIAGGDESCHNIDCNNQCMASNRPGICLYEYCWCREDKKPKQERVWKRLSEIPQ